MHSVLFHKGLQLSIVYVEEIPYTGDPVTQPVGIVEPWPRIQVGAHLFIFVNGRHFEVEITAITPYTRSQSYDTRTAVPELMDPLRNEVGPLRGKSDLRTTAHNERGSDHGPAPSSGRKRANTLSTIVPAILEDDSLAIRHVQETFMASGPTISEHKPLSPLLEEHFPTSPPLTYPPHRVFDVPDAHPFLTQNLKGRQAEMWRSGTSQPPYIPRARTFSDAAVSTTLEENRGQIVPSSRQLRPSDSASPVIVSSTRTPTPRRRTVSDAVESRLKKTTMPWKALDSRTHSQLHSAHKIPSTSDANTRVPRSSLLNSAKIWANSVHFPKRNKETGSPGCLPSETVAVEKTTLIATNHVPSMLPRRPALVQVPTNSSTIDTSVPRRSWVPQVEWDINQFGEEDREVDHLMAMGSLGETQDISHPDQTDTGNSVYVDKGKRREHPHKQGSIVRVPLDTSAGSSPAHTSGSLSKAESRRLSARKELPPIPVTEPLQFPSDSLLRSEIQEEEEEQRYTSSGMSLGAALELTPPATPTPPDLVEMAPEPTMSQRSRHRRRHSEVPARKKESASLSTAADHTRSSTSASKPSDRERGMRNATPTPLEQMHTLVPAGSMQSVRTRAKRSSDVTPTQSLADMFEAWQTVETILSADADGVARRDSSVAWESRPSAAMNRGSGAGEWLASKDNGKRKQATLHPPIEQF